MHVWQRHTYKQLAKALSSIRLSDPYRYFHVIPDIDGALHGLLQVSERIVLAQHAYMLFYIRRF